GPRAGTTNGSSASSSNAGPPYNASSGASATGGGAGAGSGAASQGQATSTAAPVAAPDLPVVSGLTPDRGPRSGGTWVTIEGSGFTGTTVVRFGSHAARFVVLSDSRLRAEAPAGAAGSVDVEVTTPPGTSVPSPSGRYSYQ
ncbi:MAG TPA: IPT/TIG domain-containing protein, partial [Acidimicrobiales bacterium]|nr:IPT/TIG domain-containing protein [Acidimicrobiales bacterium]